jgi:hypothetical protein
MTKKGTTRRCTTGGRRGMREVAALPRGRRESRSKRLNKNNCEFILDFEFDLFLPTKLKVSCALVKN